MTRNGDGLENGGAPNGRPVPVVAIGASAGGLEALTQLIQALPRRTGLAYVIVQHLAPTHESLLAELLGRVAPFPIVQATDGVRVVADHAYTMPPDTTIQLIDGHLTLAPRRLSPEPPHPIDAFFGSLADVHGSGAIGIILSGTGGDGAAGLEAIKRAGGLTFAQEASSARFEGMPAAAIATGCVDFVLSPPQIAERLVYIGQHPYGRLPMDGSAGEASAIDRDALKAIFELLYSRFGVDFAQYKEGTIRRRLLRRLLLRRVDTLPAYVTLLGAEVAEVEALYTDLLIGFTRFFRDADAFAALTDTAFPKLFADRVAGVPIRVWVAGCATGEEAYSMAIGLLEFADGDADDLGLQIFGTDLSESAIAVARAGVYPLAIEADVSPDRLRRFFVREDKHYRISRAVRERCVFSRHNVTLDPPFAQLDLVSCRNVLIYLRPDAHSRVFAIFHYALKPSGLLVLGRSESVSMTSGLFSSTDTPHRIFKRDAELARPPTLGRMTPGYQGLAAQGLTLTGAPAPTALDVQRSADQIVLGLYAPSGVVVDDALQVVQFRGHTGNYLEPPSGIASYDVLRMVEGPLRTPLRAALRRAKDVGEVVMVRDVRLVEAGAGRRVDLRVVPFKVGMAKAPFFLVLFDDLHAGRDLPAAGAMPRQWKRRGRRQLAKDAPGRRSGAVQEMDALRRQLEELANEHQSFEGELQAANEEVQSRNVELQSNNEEFQTANEELQTTKEELESGNEELMTLNDELRAQHVETARLNDDLTNVLAVMRVPLVIVGADLRVRRATAAADPLFHLVSTDVGRSIRDITPNPDIRDLESVINGVLTTLVPHEREIRDDAGRWFALTIRPYTTADRLVDGAVIICHDVDTRRRYSRALEVARTTADVANRAKSGFLATMSHELRTPLNAIMGYAALLAEGVRGAINLEQAEDLARIRAAGTHLIGLINDVLNYAKLESSQVHFAEDIVPMADALLVASAMVEVQARAKGITFERLPADPTVAVRGDREKVLQILLNLLSNAIKFTRDGGRVSLTCDLNHALVRVLVRDSGRGIAVDELGRIFEPFIQVGRTLSGPEAGVGLGLSISRELARGMGGDLTVESVHGEGSTFTLELRRVIAVNPTVAPPQ